jgi:hypothetical protein
MPSTIDDERTIAMDQAALAPPPSVPETVDVVRSAPPVPPSSASPASVPSAPGAAVFAPSGAEPAPMSSENASSSSTGAPRPAGSLAFLLLLSYASAVTIGLVYLLLTRSPESQQRHQLEDLRDPVDEEGTVRIYQRGAELPPGHSLQLAGRQRFGNILVEPLRITRGPVEFDHYTRNSRKQQPPTPPVLKLWLRLTNVSTDQEVAPLDSLLLFKRELNREGELVSNTFVAPLGRLEEGPVVFAYPAAQNSEWDMRGQELGRKLAPGESLETFVPSDSAGLDELLAQEELTWRFHLRKGYAPTGRGVTTLVEVSFRADDVQAESPSA